MITLIGVLPDHVHIAADRVDLAVLQRADQKATLPADAGNGDSPLLAASGVADRFRKASSRLTSSANDDLVMIDRTACGSYRRG